MRTMLILAVASLAASPVLAAAPTKTAPKKPTLTAKPTDAQLKQARDTLSMFVSAFNSSDIPPPTKEGLFLCLYGNPLGKIARGHVAAMAAAKIPASASPTQKLEVLAGLCGAPWPVSGAEKPAGR